MTGALGPPLLEPVSTGKEENSAASLKPIFTLWQNGESEANPGAQVQGEGEPVPLGERVD